MDEMRRHSAQNCGERRGVAASGREPPPPLQASSRVPRPALLALQIVDSKLVALQLLRGSMHSELSGIPWPNQLIDLCAPAATGALCRKRAMMSEGSASSALKLRLAAGRNDARDHVDGLTITLAPRAV